MTTAIEYIINSYKIYVGSSKIIPLYLVALMAIYFINAYDNNSERRRINPAVFLLSLWSGIAYAITRCIKKPAYKGIITALFGIYMIVFAGDFVFTKEAMPYSIYYYTDNKITAISILSIVAFFVLYYLISTQLFDDMGSRIIFMGFVVLLHLFADYSDKSLQMSLFLYPLSLQSIFLHDFMPFALWGYLIYEKNKPQEEEIPETVEDDYYEEEWDMKKHKIINIRNMAIAVGVLAVAVAACVFLLNYKINNLYSATVALEEAARGKVSMYEFIPEGSNHAEASLIVSGDGNVTVLGGGSSENGQGLYDFITEHTVNVDRWYLYGHDDANIGAFDYCMNLGITVDKCYYVSLEEVE